MAEANQDAAKQSLIKRIGNLLTGRNVPRPKEEPDMGTQTGRDLKDLFYELFGPSRDRYMAYRDYEDMEVDSPVVCSALDATADTAVSGAEGDAESVFELQFEEKNDAISKIFDDLDGRTKLRSDARKVIRSFLLYGDCFQEIVIGKQANEIAALKPLPARSMMMIPEETMQARNSEFGFEQWDPETGGKVGDFMPWQVVHYATKVNPEDLYGRSMLFSARRTYRQLQMIEDSVVVNRLTRSTMRLVRTVPAPGMTAEAAQKFVNTLQLRHARRQRWDTNTGKLILEGNPMSEETDIWVADMGNGAKGDVKVLEAQSGADKIEDVAYFQRKLFASLRVPPSYLGWEQDSAGKAQIVTVDIAFARLVRNAQLTHGIGVRQVIDTEIALHGKDPEDVEYDLIYAPIASVDEMRRWQVELLKIQVAQLMKETGIVVDDEYLLRQVLEVEEEYVKDLLAKAEEEKAKQEALAKEIAKSGGLMAPKVPGKPVKGGQPAGEKPPKPGQEGKTPPVRGSTKEQTIERIFDRRRRSRSIHVPTHVHEAVRKIVKSPDFKKKVNELYEFTQSLTVTRAHSIPIEKQQIMEAAGIKKPDEPATVTG